MFRTLLKRIFLACAPHLLGLVFDRRYFCGRWFEGNHMGWIWLLQAVWFQKILGFNRDAPIPVVPGTKVSNWKNIVFHADNIDNFQSSGCYFQNFAATIYIGQGTYIAPNVGIITANHDPRDPDVQLPGEDVRIGRKCWIGMGAVILPGVELGDHTVVAAGAVVARSPARGRCVLAGVPARIIKTLEEQDTAC